jgi:molybdenum cofactor cytidylyltransferase
MASRDLIFGILLAAGASNRFGGGKLLHALPDGTPIGVAALRSLRAALPHVVAVVRPEDTELSTLFARENAQVVACADAVNGMAHSLACGIRAAPRAFGWIVALGDMPAVSAQTHRSLADELEAGARIVAPYCGGQRGNPVGFSGALRDELLRLTGDAGARALLEAYAAQVRRLNVDDPGVLRDVDTLADLQDLPAPR